MKKSLALVFKRREKILEELKKNGSIYVNDLAKKFNVSPLTIRRDLELFEKKNMIEKSYGKATYLGNPFYQKREIISWTETAKKTLENEKRIAQFASQFVEDGMTVYVNSGVMSLLFIQAISKKEVTIFTNNILVYNANLDKTATLFLTGGEIHNDTSLVGDISVQNLTAQMADICFLGADAIDEQIISTYSLSETLINRTMIEYTTGRKFIMAEARKVGEQTNFMTTHTKMITDFITDTTADHTYCKRIENQNVQVFFV